ncbi:MAG: D-alanyl-D-alanine carboxypeptidase [Clostridia bacterium]|nr:D-alanyl-D-alanine carboxypeptidase [Clostridia bacterium]
MRRLLFIFIAAAMLLSLLPFSALCEQQEIAPQPTPAPAQSMPPKEDADPFADITTPYIYLIEADTGALLYSREGDTRAFPASTTKIMSALVAVENLPDLNKVITLGWRPVVGFGPTSSLMGLEVGEQISLIDMLYGMLLRSGNDAAKAIAIETAYEHFGSWIDPADSVSLFVSLMNEKARELGMSSTHFATVDGRHDEEHYTTAHDFAILMNAALKNPIVAQILSTPTYQVQATNIHPNGFYFENSNRLICTKSSDTESFLYEYCIGGKTGETNEAGYCLVSAARRNGVTLILVQFGDSNTGTTSYYRYQTAPVIYEWGFENYRAFALSEFNVQTDFELAADNCSPFDPENGRFTAKAAIDGLSITGAYTSIREYMENPARIITVVNSDYAEAPIRKGDVVGYVDYHFYENAFIRANLIAQRDVASASDIDIEPHETAFISVTFPPGSGKKTVLGIEHEPGADQYTVWHYYNGSLYTSSSDEWHYLTIDGGVFKAEASSELVGRVALYRRCFDSNGEAYYRREDSVSDGAEYAIVADGMALCASSQGGSLKASPVILDGSGIITGGIGESMIWRFSSHSTGYRIANASRYLVRKGPSGVLFWVLLLVIALIALIVVRLLVLRKKHSRRRRNAKRYRATMR